MVLIGQRWVSCECITLEPSVMRPNLMKGHERPPSVLELQPGGLSSLLLRQKRHLSGSPTTSGAILSPTLPSIGLPSPHRLDVLLIDWSVVCKCTRQPFLVFIGDNICSMVIFICDLIYTHCVYFQGIRWGQYRECRSEGEAHECAVRGIAVYCPFHFSGEVSRLLCWW